MPSLLQNLTFRAQWAIQLTLALETGLELSLLKNVLTELVLFITSWFVMISAQPVRLIYYTILPSVCYHWWLQPSQFFTFLEMGEEFRIQHLASILTKSLKTTLKGEQVAKEFLENKTKFVTAQVSLSAGQWSCKTFPRWTRTRQKWILLRKLLRLKISYQFMTS